MEQLLALQLQWAKWHAYRHEKLTQEQRVGIRNICLLSTVVQTRIQISNYLLTQLGKAAVGEDIADP